MASICKDARIVTFANGFGARELIVDVERRLAYAARSDRLAHHNASFQLFAEGARTRLLWLADVLPNAAAPVIDAMMEQGAAVMKRTLETQAK